MLASLGWEGIKPLLTALVLPPVPLLLLLAFGVRQAFRQRPLSAWASIGLASVALWLCSCVAIGDGLERLLLPDAVALSEARITELRQLPSSRKLAIAVLGGGREPVAPEYGEAHLSALSMQRLHYAHWLARRLGGAPILFSGGVGREQDADGPAEAEVAARIADRDYGRRLRWLEKLSRDTRENAAASVPLLTADGVTDIVVVTHGWHMPRAERAFSDVARRQPTVPRIVPAPVGLARHTESPLLRWLPTAAGVAHVRTVLREALGLFMGA
ncbi:MAG TPA: YdcF family protein [Aquabacterium sp.]|nr:YdcF family protein [Aquabacterium sp.]